MFILGRVAVAIGLLLAVSVLIFIATAILPGDAASAILGRRATPDTLHALRVELGLNKSLPEQYLTWISGAIHGDLGLSAASRLPIQDTIQGPFINTIVLATAAALGLGIVGIVLGTVAGLREQKAVDHAISWAALVALSVPDFVVASILALVLAVQLRWFHATSILPANEPAYLHPDVLILPALTIVIIGTPFIIRMVRAGVIDASHSEFVMMAHLNGFNGRAILGRYLLRNSLPATIQVYAQMVQWLVGGVFIVETVFAYPGIGLALVNAVQIRDMPFVQAVGLIIAALYIFLNLIADVAVILSVPKLRSNPQ